MRPCQKNMLSLRLIHPCPIQRDTQIQLVESRQKLATGISDLEMSHSE